MCTPGLPRNTKHVNDPRIYFAVYVKLQQTLRPRSLRRWSGHIFFKREAEEALAPGGDLEKDQLDRVTLVDFIRWCRLRERKKAEAEGWLRSPPPAWRERLRFWREVITVSCMFPQIVLTQYVDETRFGRPYMLHWVPLITPLRACVCRRCNCSCMADDHLSPVPSSVIHRLLCGLRVFFLRARLLFCTLFGMSNLSRPRSGPKSIASGGRCSPDTNATQ